jgi:surface polysaccharide O-acyltransferase-like enzyme
MEKIKENKKNIIDNKNINKNPYKNNKRNYGIDLSRIISMLLIINHHIIYHGGPLNKYGKTSFYYKLIIFFNLICCSGVNIFGIISGAIGFYSHKYSNLIYLLLITFFYNIVIALIFKIVSPNLVKDINYFLYPLFITDYWYFNAYFIMYFFLPLINKGIIEMNKKSMMYFIINLFLIISILDVIRNFNKRLLFVDIFLLRGGFSYFWLIILYLFGGYIGRFKIDIYKNRNFFFYIKYLILIIFSGFIRTKIIIYRIKKKNFPIIVDYTAPSEVIISFSIVMILSNI